MARKRRKRPHGMGCVYERSPGNWWIKWLERGETRYAHGYETREEAERVRAKIIAEVTAERDGLPTDYSKTQRLAELAPEWLARRAHTHRAIKTDRSRWRKHLEPAFGKQRPAEVDASRIRRYVEEKLAGGLNPSTVGHTLKLLSSFFSCLVEERLAPSNPVSTLPKATRRLCRSNADPRLTLFLECADHIERVFAALPEPFNVAFAISRKPTFVRPHTLNHHLRRALATCGLPRLTWYRATRHTFASHWVLNNGSMEKPWLREPIPGRPPVE